MNAELGLQDFMGLLFTHSVFTPLYTFTYTTHK
jgi:hypothetical protein